MWFKFRLLCFQASLLSNAFWEAAGFSSSIFSPSFTFKKGRIRERDLLSIGSFSQMVAMAVISNWYWASLKPRAFSRCLAWEQGPKQLGHLLSQTHTGIAGHNLNPYSTTPALMAQVLGSPPHTWETWVMPLATGFNLVQLWLLRAFGV